RVWRRPYLRTSSGPAKGFVLLASAEPAVNQFHQPIEFQNVSRNAKVQKVGQGCFFQPDRILFRRDSRLALSSRRNLGNVSGGVFMMVSKLDTAADGNTKAFNGIEKSFRFGDTGERHYRPPTKGLQLDLPVIFKYAFDRRVHLKSRHTKFRNAGNGTG